MDSSPNILVVRTGGVGDMIMALPALRAIRRGFPGSRITFLTSSDAVGVLGDQVPCDDVVAFGRSPERKGGILCRSRFKQAAWMFRLYAQKFDIVAILQPIMGRAGALRLKSIVRLSRAAESYGRNTNGMGGFYTQSVDEPLDNPTHEVERALAVAKLMGVEGLADISLQIPEQDRNRVNRLLNLEGLQGRKLIAVNAGSLRPSHRWPPERFAEAADILANRYAGAVVLLGSPGERSLEPEILPRVKSPKASLIGKTSLNLLPAVLDGISLLLTNDTGTMHVAASVGTKTVAVFGPSDIRRVRPFAPDSTARVVSRHICGRQDGFGCRSSHCLLNVGVQDVVDAAGDLMG